jgi:hypothetical protein
MLTVRSPQRINDAERHRRATLIYAGRGSR